MRPPDYDLVNAAGEVVAQCAIATGGYTSREAHLDVLLTTPTNLMFGRHTLRHRETGRVAARFEITPDAVIEEEHPDIAERLTLSSKPDSS